MTQLRVLLLRAPCDFQGGSLSRPQSCGLDLGHMHNPSKSKLLFNQRGFLAADFLFSMIIAAMVSMILLAVTSTYSLVAVAQYIAFSGARAMAGSDVELSQQRQKATDKVNALINSPPLKPLFATNTSWFKLSLKDIKTGGHSSSGGDSNDNYSDEYPTREIGPGQFIPAVGLRLEFEAKLLNLKAGPLGESGDNEGQGYKATVTGFLIRETSTRECQVHLQENNRYQRLLSLDPAKYKTVVDKNGSASGKYIPLEDNGC